MLFFRYSLLQATCFRVLESTKIIFKPALFIVIAAEKWWGLESHAAFMYGNPNK